MPNVPKPRLRRWTRTRGDVAAAPPAPETPNVEIIEAEGLRWINIERPRPIDRAWLEEHFDFHPLDYEDVFSRNQRPKIDEYDDYLFIVLHFARFDKRVQRLNAAEVDIFVGPDYMITLPNEPLDPLEYLFERCRTREDVRRQLFSRGPGYLLYKVVDDCVDASFPMLRKMGNKLERLEEDIFEGRSEEIVRDLSNAKQEIINFRKIVRPQRTSLRDLEKTKQKYFSETLDVYFDDIVDASERVWDMLENYKEVVAGARGDERVGDLAPRQRHRADPDRDLGRRPPAHADRLDLGHERAGARRGPDRGLLRDHRRDAGPAGRHAGVLPLAPLPVGDCGASNARLRRC